MRDSPSSGLPALLHSSPDMFLGEKMDGVEYAHPIPYHIESVLLKHLWALWTMMALAVTSQSCSLGRTERIKKLLISCRLLPAIFFLFVFWCVCFSLSLKRKKKKELIKTAPSVGMSIFVVVGMDTLRRHCSSFFLWHFLLTAFGTFLVCAVNVDLYSMEMWGTDTLNPL